MTWPVIPDDFLLASVGDRELVFDRSSGRSHLANEMASTVLRQRDGFESIVDATVRLCEIYQAPQDIVKRDLTQFVTQLRDIAPPRGAKRAPLLRRPSMKRRAEVPTDVDRQFTIDVLGLDVVVVSHDAVSTTHVAPLLESVPCGQGSDVRLHIWVQDGAFHIAMDDRLVTVESRIGYGVSTLFSLLTAIGVDAERTGLLVHAAGIEVGGSAIVVMGASNQGKSSTTVELMREGAKYISDEIVAIDVQSGGISGFPRPIGLEGAARWHHPELRPLWTKPDQEDWRWPVPPSTLGAVSVGGPLGLIAHLQYDLETGAQTRRLSLPEAVSHLGGQLLHPHQVDQPSLVRIVALLEATPAYAIHHSGAKSACNAVLGLLEDHRAP